MFEKIVFTGQQKDIFQLLSAIDIGVLTSDSEGFPNAILEYMACGIPTVATDGGGNRELIDHNLNGYLQPPGDAQSIANAILKLISDKNLRVTMGESAKLKVIQKFTLKSMISNTENYYSLLL